MQNREGVPAADKDTDWNCFASIFKRSVVRRSAPCISPENKHRHLQCVTIFQLRIIQIPLSLYRDTVIQGLPSVMLAAFGASTFRMLALGIGTNVSVS